MQPATTAAENIVEPQIPIEQPKIKEATLETRRNYLETVLGPDTDQSNKENQPVKSERNEYTPEFFLNGPRVKVASLPVPSGPPIHSLSRPTLPTFNDFPSANYYIDCNYCGRGIENEHYHCSICHNGDYDLCLECIENDIICEGEGHWLIKRSLKDGKLVNSTTETIAPKKQEKSIPKVEIAEEPQSPPAIPDGSDRTCNGCIGGEYSFQSLLRNLEAKHLTEFSNEMLVTCLDCPDFDLCYPCLFLGSHGHDPAHEFRPLSDSERNDYASSASRLCSPGRDAVHAAICDGCNKVRSLYDLLNVIR